MMCTDDWGLFIISALVIGCVFGWLAAKIHTYHKRHF